jgi:hypothetical protein
MMSTTHKARSALCLVTLGWVLAGSCGWTDAAKADDRISVSGDYSTLTGTNGGGGGSATWLHDLDASSVGTIGGEYEELSDAWWSFGSLALSRGFGPANQRYTVYGEIHEGGGHDGLHSFDYHIEAVGVFATFNHSLSVQLEDKRIDVENTHGNLPKAGLSYLWNPHFMTSVSYQYSVTGNLVTRISGVRLDYYSAAVNLLAGGSYGPTLPVTFDLPSGFFSDIRRVKEGFIGASKPIPRWHSEITLVADYIDLSGIKRSIFTLTYLFHIPH